MSVGNMVLVIGRTPGFRPECVGCKSAAIDNDGVVWGCGIVSNAWRALFHEADFLSDREMKVSASLEDFRKEAEKFDVLFEQRNVNCPLTPKL